MAGARASGAGVAGEKSLMSALSIVRAAAEILRPPRRVPVSKSAA
jgi:hypothetical protein